MARASQEHARCPIPRPQPWRRTSRIAVPSFGKIYDRILTVARKSGPVREEPKKTSIHLARKTAFAGIATRKDALILTLKSDSDIASPRVLRRERASANRWHVEFRLVRTGEVDRELTGWLKRAYDLAG